MRAEASFFHRVHYLDRLQVSVSCEEIRTHAFRMRYELAVTPGEGGGVPRPSARVVIAQAVTTREDFVKREVPDDLRAALTSVFTPPTSP